MSKTYQLDDPRVIKLKAIIKKLHHGADPLEVKEEFAHEFKYVSGSEIAAMEMALVADGLDVSEIMKLCDVHAMMFYDNIFEIHAEKVKDHPIEEYSHENRVIESYLKAHFNEDILEKGLKDFTNVLEALPHLVKLYDLLDQHYQKKEQRLFPLLEASGITTIPQVMWGVHDEIRDKFKNLKTPQDQNQVTWFEDLKVAIDQAVDMIKKEENILFNVLKENLTTEQWDTLVTINHSTNHQESFGELPKDGAIKLPSGSFNINELVHLLNILPVDITFVDKDDRVAYVSQGKHRIFDRPLTVIGREVRYCHPPKSLERVEKIIEDFKEKRADHADFWLNFKGMYVYIQYFALYDNNGDYLGVVEVSQDIKPIQAITGEKRLAD